jgi:hypothetical protein
MNQTLYKITTLFFICFLVVAAFHEAVPGICTAQVPSQESTCPFCNILYTLVILCALVLLTEPSQICLPYQDILLQVVPARFNASLLFRGPPAIIA